MRFEDIYNQKMKLYEAGFTNNFSNSFTNSQNTQQQTTQAPVQGQQPNTQQNAQQTQQTQTQPAANGEDELDILLKTALQMDPNQAKPLLNLKGEQLTGELVKLLQARQGQQPQQGV